MTDDTPMSQQGRVELEAELERLKTVERPRIADEIRVARSYGDLKENAEYHEVKRAQGHLETRIARLDAQPTHLEQLRHPPPPSPNERASGRAGRRPARSATRP